MQFLIYIVLGILSLSFLILSVIDSSYNLLGIFIRYYLPFYLVSFFLIETVVIIYFYRYKSYVNNKLKKIQSNLKSKSKFLDINNFRMIVIVITILISLFPVYDSNVKLSKNKSITYIEKSIQRDYQDYEYILVEETNDEITYLVAKNEFDGYIYKVSYSKYTGTKISIDKDLYISNESYEHRFTPIKLIFNKSDNKSDFTQLNYYSYDGITCRIDSILISDELDDKFTTKLETNHSAECDGKPRKLYEQVDLKNEKYVLLNFDSYIYINRVDSHNGFKHIRHYKIENNYYGLHVNKLNEEEIEFINYTLKYNFTDNSMYFTQFDDEIYLEEFDYAYYNNNYEWIKLEHSIDKGMSYKRELNFSDEFINKYNNNRYEVRVHIDAYESSKKATLNVIDSIGRSKFKVIYNFETGNYTKINITPIYSNLIPDNAVDIEFNLYENDDELILIKYILDDIQYENVYLLDKKSTNYELIYSNEYNVENFRHEYYIPLYTEVVKYEDEKRFYIFKNTANEIEIYDRITKERYTYDAPYDERYNNMMSVVVFHKGYPVDNITELHIYPNNYYDKEKIIFDIDTKTFR